DRRRHDDRVVFSLRVPELVEVGVASATQARYECEMIVVAVPVGGNQGLGGGELVMCVRGAVEKHAHGIGENLLDRVHAEALVRPAQYSVETARGCGEQAVEGDSEGKAAEVEQAGFGTLYLDDVACVRRGVLQGEGNAIAANPRGLSLADYMARRVVDHQ